MVQEKLLGPLGHGLGKKSLCRWETAALSLSTQFIWVTLRLGLIVCSGTQSLLDALQQLRGPPQQWWGMGQQRVDSESTKPKRAEASGTLRAACSRAGAGTGASHRSWGSRWVRVGLLQRSWHLRREQRKREKRGKHYLDNGCAP